MARRLTKVAATTAAATALVAGGYAIGTRSDGAASAAKVNRAAGPYGGWRGDHGHCNRAAALSTLAGKLGVTETALRNALRDLRPQRREARDAHRAEHVSELAKALGISEAKVRAALDKVRPQSGPGRHHGPGERRRDRASRPDRTARIDALAKALGMQPKDVQAALETLRGTRKADKQQRRDDFATALAGKLGIDAAKTKAALDDFAAQRPPRGWHRRHRP
jgi:biotin operon repressor